MPAHTFVLNQKSVTVDVEDDVRLLWVIRDIVGLTGPKYGCGINVCKACTSHLNGRGFNPCSVRVGDLPGLDTDDDRVVLARRLLREAVAVPHTSGNPQSTGVVG